MDRSIRSLAALLCCAVFPAAAGAQTTWWVDGNNTPPGTGTFADPYSSIDYAVQHAATLDDDEIVVQPGTYTEGLIHVDKRLVIRSAAGPLQTICSGTSFRLHDQGRGTNVLVLEGFTIRDNSTAVHVSYASLKRCVLTANNTALQLSGDASVDHVTICGNVQGFSAGGLGQGLFMTNSIVDLGQGPGPADNVWGSITHSAGNVWWMTGNPTGTLVGEPFLHPDPAYAGFLLPNSLCIDSASPGSPADPDGSPADMGAIPFDSNVLPQPKNYCQSFPNSSGVAATIDWQGNTSHTANAFVLTAQGAPAGTPAMFFYGTQPGGAIFGNGILCSAPGSILRLGPAQNTDGAGAITRALDLTAAPAVSGAGRLLPGSTAYFQLWFRDPAGGGPNLTNGLSVTFVP